MFSIFKKKQLEIGAPTDGRVINLSKVSDPVFSQKMMDDGFAVKPSIGEVVSPVNGTVKSIFPSLHAVTITDDSGVDLLIHIGIDTVGLNGEGFTQKANVGDRVLIGEAIVEVDLHVLEENGKESTVIVVFPELQDKRIIVVEGEVRRSDIVAKIK